MKLIANLYLVLVMFVCAMGHPAALSQMTYGSESSQIRKDHSSQEVISECIEGDNIVLFPSDVSSALPRLIFLKQVRLKICKASKQAFCSCFSSAFARDSSMTEGSLSIYSNWVSQSIPDADIAILSSRAHPPTI
jgi:hypothetical protein